MVNLVKIRFWVPALLLIAGCNQPTEPIASPPTSSSPAVTPLVPPPEEPPPASPTPSPVTPQPTPPAISAAGIGEARLGMTLGELRQALGAEVEFVPQSPFMVDFDAIAVQRGGEVQYYILHLAGQPFTDDEPIQGLLTANPRYKTAEGVGAGTPIAEAEAAYGQVTLSYNTQNESREYARFDRQPFPNLSFATGNGNQEVAGVYANPTAEFNETQEYYDGAVIRSVLLICLTEGCTPP